MYRGSLVLVVGVVRVETPRWRSTEPKAVSTALAIAGDMDEALHRVEPGVSRPPAITSHLHADLLATAASLNDPDPAVRQAAVAALLALVSGAAPTPPHTEGPITTWRRVASIIGMDEDTLKKHRTRLKVQGKAWFRDADEVIRWWRDLVVGERTTATPTQRSKPSEPPRRDRPAAPADGITLADYRASRKARKTSK